MKKFLFTLVIALIASVNVMGMTKSRSRQEAYFLTDKMAYELHLTPNQVQDVYEICYDYFRSLGSVYGLRVVFLAVASIQPFGILSESSFSCKQGMVSECIYPLFKRNTLP